MPALVGDYTDVILLPAIFFTNNGKVRRVHLLSLSEGRKAALWHSVFPQD